MQEHSQTTRQQIWDKLYTIFNRHSNGEAYLTPGQLDGIIKEILGDEGEAEMAYVVKNLHKIDANGNGRIEFGEFTNYLLKRYCGELALQRMHKDRLSSNQREMKLTCLEFLNLLHTAFAFIGVSVPVSAIDEIFKLTDTNQDGFISYTEYFKFIETYICDFHKPIQGSAAKLKSKPTITSPEISEMLIRFRRLLWGELFRIYVKYDADGNGNMDDSEMTLLLKELLNETSKSELDYVFKNSFRMDANGDSSFVFEEFAIFFIKHACEIGLSRYNRSRATGGRRDISTEDFSKLFKGSFCFLESGLVGDKIINRVFSKIDRDNDGSISYKQYLQWTNQLLSYRQIDGLPCFLYQPRIEEVLEPTPMKPAPEEIDNSEFSAVKPFDLDKKDTSVGNSTQNLNSHSSETSQNVSTKHDERGFFNPSETKILTDRNNTQHQDKTGLKVKKIVNLSLNQQSSKAHDSNSQNVLDPHIHMSTRDRMKSKLEATSNANTRIDSYIQQGLKIFENPKLQHRSLVPKLNLKSAPFNDAASIRSTTSSVSKAYSSKSLAERIKQHTLKLLLTFDTNNNRVVDPDEVETILIALLKSKELEIKYVTKNFFRYNQEKKKQVTFEMFTEFFLGLHCGEMAVQRYHGSGMFSRSKELIMNLNEFIMSFQGALDYIEFLAPMGELKQLFKEIDANRDGWISYKEYFQFLKYFFTYLPECTKKALSRNPSLSSTPITSPLHSARSGVLDEQPEDTISTLIRNQTLVILNKYGGSSRQFDIILIKNVLIQIFGGVQSQIDQVIQSFREYDSDCDGVLTTEELLTFIMEKYCGETILHRLHDSNKFIRCQDRLLGNHDFMTLIDTAFSYLDFKPRREDLINLFKSLDTDNDGYITYRKYFAFIREHLGTYKQQENQRKKLVGSPTGSSNFASSPALSERSEIVETRARVPSATFLKA